MRAAALVVLLLLFPALAQAADWYVSGSGKDNNTGTSAASPWRTLQKAADAAQNGDTLHVAAGSYDGLSLSQKHNLRILGAGGAVVSRPSGTGVELSGCNDLFLSGLTISDCGDAGLLATDCDRLTVEDVTLDGNGKKDVLKESNLHLVRGADALLHRLVSEDAGRHGIRLQETTRTTVRGCVISAAQQSGIQIGSSLELHTVAAVVERNQVAGCTVGADFSAGLDVSSSERAVVRNNLVVGTVQGYGIDVHDLSVDALLVNNTVVQPDGAGPALRFGGNVNTRLLNSILLHENGPSIAVITTMNPPSTSDHNLLTDSFLDGLSLRDLAGWRAARNLDAHSLAGTVTGMFVDSGAGDYHLAAGSPAIDHGTSANAPLVDLDGTTRPLGAAVDIGAYEAVPSAPPDAGMPFDADLPGPDAAQPGEDAAVPGPDAAQPALDAAEPSDAEQPDPDSSVPGEDASTPPDATLADAAVPDAALADAETPPDAEALADAGVDSGPTPADAGPDAAVTDASLLPPRYDLGGCGCSHGGPLATALAAAFLVLVPLRRRR